MLLADGSASDEEAAGSALLELEDVANGLAAEELAAVGELEKQAVEPLPTGKGSETTDSPDERIVRSRRYEPG